jgi:hypothetical protein
MTITSKQPVHYSSARRGTAPATYAQRHMFAKLSTMEPTTWPQNILQVVPVPDGLTVVEVREAVHDLVLRHESLRTRFRRDADGTLWQYLSADGEIGCEIWEVAGEDPDVVGTLAERELEHTNFDLVADAPLRALVGTLHGAPTVAMIVTSHIATDMLSARLVRQDLVDLLSACCKGELAPELPLRRQPLDQAAFEATIGPATTGRSLASWRRRMTTAPPSMFGIRPEPSAPREFLRAELTSTAMSLAADALGRRYQLTTTAVVLMAAEAVLLAHYAGADRCALQTAVGNRISPDLIWSTGVIRQHSLAVIDVRGASFEQVIRRTWSAWMHAQRHGVFDPGALDEVRAEVQTERGIALSLGAYFNDLRIQTRPRTEEPAARILAAADTTRFAWTEEYPADYMEFQLRLEDVGAATRMSALVDTAAVPRDRVRELLVGMERLLVWQATAGVAADGPLTAERLAVITGMSAFEPPPSWVKVNGSWVDLAATRQLLAQATDGSPSTVRGSDDGRLVGYVSGPFTPEQLHDRCVTTLTGPRFGSRAAHTPHHYVVCAQGDGDWADRPVLMEGSGRP